LKLTALIAELDAELAALAPSLTTFAARYAAVNARGGVRGRYLSRLNGLARTSSDLLRTRVGTEIANKCDSFVTELLPPADSGRYVGVPRGV